MAIFGITRRISANVSQNNITLYITTPIRNEPISNLYLQKQSYFNITFHIPACMPGYIGINCTSKCPYPTYGHGCQGFCDCNEVMCDVSNGCEPITTGIFTCSRYI